MPPSDDRLAALRADVCRRVPDPPGLDEVVEDAGRQRLAAYYLYSALLAGVIDDDALAPALGRLANELRALRAQTDAELAGRSQ